MRNHSEQSPNPDADGPRRGERFAHPACAGVWAAIASLDEASKHDLLAALSEHVGVPSLDRSPEQARKARAIAALREAQRLREDAGLSGPLSVAEFRRLRAEQPQADWPNDANIRRWLGGSWNDALRSAHLGCDPLGNVSVRPMGPSFTLEEILEAVRACVADLGYVPSFGGYLAWVRRPEVRAREGRRPTSQGPFDNRGGWQAVLIAAKLITDPLEQASAGSDGARAADATVGLRPAAFRFKPGHLRQALNECADGLGRSPRVHEYMEWRRDRLKQQPNRPVPSYAVMLRAHGTWDDALDAAGLARLGGRATSSAAAAERQRRQPGNKYTGEQFLSALRRALAERGAPLTSGDYTRWRTETLAAARAAGGQVPRIPAVYAFYSRFGRWQTALDAAARGGDAA